MCKLLVITKTDKIKNIERAVNTIAMHLQDDQRDGFGYAIGGVNGVYGERTIAEEFKSRAGKTNTVPQDLIIPEYNSFGEVSTPYSGGIFHGRTSTNALGLKNTHPLQKHDWTLIHNGVVSNHGPMYNQITDNDTEHLIEYLGTTGVSDIEKHVTGYYAIGAFDPQGNLHVIKDSIASLYIVMNKSLNCLMFGTTIELLENISDEMKWKIGPIEKLKNDVHLVFNPEGILIQNNTIKSRGYDQREAKHASKSLGRILNDRYDHYNYMDRDYDMHEEFSEQSWSKYKDEVYGADAGYKFMDWNKNELTHAQFMKLDDASKMYCTVVRPDGTVVDPEDYMKVRIA